MAMVSQAPCLPAPSPKDSGLVVTFLLIPSRPLWSTSLLVCALASQSDQGSMVDGRLG